MAYSIQITRRAQKELAALPVENYTRLKAAIFALAENPRPAGCVKLADQEAWRIRVGDYRVIYEIEDKELTVIVVLVGHRREIYR